MRPKGQAGGRQEHDKMFDQTKRCAITAGLLTALAAVAAAPVAAQTPTLAGKNVTMLIGFGPGGGYDSWGRVVARHIGRHLPGNPNVVPQNMPGGGSFNAANHIYTIAPKDGTVFGIIARDAALGPLTGAPGARFDPLKISWIGTPTTETNICIATDKAKVKTVKDLFATELIIGNTGVGTGTYSYPKALNGMLGTKFKLISGFPSSSDVFLAMERGEIEGSCESLDSVTSKRPDWLATGKGKLLLQGGNHPSLKLEWYEDLLRDLKTRYPKFNLHAFSAPEIWNFVKLNKLPLRCPTIRNFAAYPRCRSKISSSELRDF
jgi:hypothetical protein